MTATGTVRALWRYPVSSLGGERVDSLEVSPDGAEGDRIWGLLDPATGGTARPEQERWSRVASIPARRAGSGIEIEVGSRWLAGGEEAADAAISAMIGRPVLLRPHGIAPRRYTLAPLHLVTTGTLDWLAAQAGVPDADARRFRPNVVIEVAGDRPEQDWMGRTLRIGPVEVRVDTPTRRCGFTIVAQSGLPHAPEVLRHLVRSNGHNLGVYASPLAAAAIRIGDAVSLV